jgi:hypothetical protein
MKPHDSDAIISDYKAAYQSATGYPIFMIRYERGWFLLGAGNGLTPTRYRAAEIQKMTARLSARRTDITGAVK